MPDHVWQTRVVHEGYCCMLRYGAAVLLFYASQAVAGVTLEVPKEVSFFEAPVIRVMGLQPLHPVTIRASCADPSGATLTSSAAFTPHTDGVVDTSLSIGNGDYHLPER
jgi:hypothetical protein